MSKDQRLIFEAYLREDRYAHENPEEFEDIDYAQRARAEDAMDKQSSLDDVAYDMIDSMGVEMEGHEILERLIRALRKEEGELHGHVIAWKNMFLDPKEQPPGGIPEGLENYAVTKLFPSVEKWAKQGSGTSDANAIVRKGLGSTLDVLDGVLMMGERQRMTMVDGPQD
jgi:hypothetical protein